MTTRTSKTLTRLARAGLLAVAMGFVALAPSTGDAAGSDCDPAKMKHPKVAAACKDGKKAVTALMKTMVKAQNKAGNSVTCESCHTELKTFARKPNAEADLAKYLK